MKEEVNKIRVLWIEDELEYYSIPQLEKDGDIEVAHAVNGTEALDKVRSDEFDIIILDIIMPPGPELVRKEIKKGYETGYVFLRIIRKELGMRAPVIIYTNYAKPLPEEEIIELNVVQYLSKPVKMAKLAEFIRLHVKGRIDVEI